MPYDPFSRQRARPAAGLPGTQQPQNSQPASSPAAGVLPPTKPQALPSPGVQQPAGANISGAATQPTTLPKNTLGSQFQRPVGQEIAPPKNALPGISLPTPPQPQPKDEGGNILDTQGKEGGLETPKAPGAYGNMDITALFDDILASHDAQWESVQGDYDRYLASQQRQAGLIASRMGGGIGASYIAGQRQATLNAAGELNKARTAWEQDRRNTLLKRIDEKIEQAKYGEDKGFQYDMSEVEQLHAVEMLITNWALENGQAYLGPDGKIVYGTPPGAGGSGSGVRGPNGQTYEPHVQDDGTTAYEILPSGDFAGMNVSQAQLDQVASPTLMGIARDSQILQYIQDNPAAAPLINNFLTSEVGRQIAYGFILDEIARSGGQIPTYENFANALSAYMLEKLADLMRSVDPSWDIHESTAANVGKTAAGAGVGLVATGGNPLGAVAGGYVGYRR